MKVGFIGLGKMGAGICSNIVKNGIDVVVYDINPANVQKFVDMGASSAATVKELAAQVEVCITCVPMPKDAKGVLLGPDGVFENLPEGGVHFDLSTLDIETVVMLEAEAAKRARSTSSSPWARAPPLRGRHLPPVRRRRQAPTTSMRNACSRRWASPPTSAM